MNLLARIEEFKSERPVILSMGNFDGLHLGHQHILRENRLLADRLGADSVVLSFYPHPITLLRGIEFYPLSDQNQQREDLQKLGMDHWILEPFNHFVMNQLPEEFIQRVYRSMNLKGIVVGADFCFGSRRQGDISFLQKQSKLKGFTLIIPPDFEVDSQRVSSTQIRSWLKGGEVDRAMQGLGHPYILRGKVEYGSQRGQKWGIATANFDHPMAKNLKLGVYKTRVKIDGEVYKGATNVGVNPTMGGVDSVRVETHLIDFNRDIYGELISVEFLEFIRSERKFSTVEDLVSQIKKDIDYVRGQKA